MKAGFVIVDEDGSRDGDSAPNRPLIPRQIGRAFRSKSATSLKGKVTLDN